MKAFYLREKTIDNFMKTKHFFLFFKGNYGSDYAGDSTALAAEAFQRYLMSQYSRYLLNAAHQVENNVGMYSNGIIISSDFCKVRKVRIS